MAGGVPAWVGSNQRLGGAMNRSRKRDVVAFVCLVGLAALAAASSILAAGCAGGAAFQKVADQNGVNAEAYATNVATLAAAARELVRVESDAMVLRARERVSQDLIRIRVSITPGEPTESELADAGASWARSLAGETADMAARINAAPPERRAVIADSLAEDHAATIDLAIATPGFSSARVLRDAVEIDRINTMIEGEPSPDVRAGYMQRRDGVLDGYLAVRNADRTAAICTSAIDRFIDTIDGQGRMLGVHSSAMKSYAAGSGLHGSAIGTFQDAQLRSAVLEIVAQTWGQRAADDVRERLRRADDAIGTLSAASH
jgi:hypothetical protein